MLYCYEDAIMVLGCIMNNVELLKSEKYHLTREDFSPSNFHQILFAVIDNLEKQLQIFDACELKESVETWRSFVIQK